MTLGIFGTSVWVSVVVMIVGVAPAASRGHRHDKTEAELAAINPITSLHPITPMRSAHGYPEEICLPQSKKYWSDLTRRSKRSIRPIHTPLNSLVFTACYPLLAERAILWIGGPAGAGKTTISRRSQDYGFMVLDCEDIWNKKHKLGGLRNVSDVANKTKQSGFLMGACSEEFLLSAPTYVFPVLLFPDFDVYTRRWHTRNPNDPQDHVTRWGQTQKVANASDRIVTIVQDSDDECVDATLFRICEGVNDKYLTKSKPLCGGDAGGGAGGATSTVP